MSERQTRGWRSFLTGWQFRTATPAFEPGQQIQAYLTDFDASRNVGVARIGDTVLTVHGVDAGDVDALMTLRVRQFDKTHHRGDAEPTSPTR